MSSHFDDCDGHCTDGAGTAPGADDNGSSVAAVLGGRARDGGHAFRGTIVFACFDGEELGLWGSNHYARGAGRSAHARARRSQQRYHRQLDRRRRQLSEERRFASSARHCRPGTDISRVNLVGSENDSPSRELSRFIAAVVPAYVAHFGPADFSRRSLSARRRSGIVPRCGLRPPMRFVEAHENFTHQHQDVRMQDGSQYGDLPQYMDPAYLAGRRRPTSRRSRPSRSAPRRPGEVRLVLSRLGYDSTLRWTPAADAVSYEILWRTTDAPQWQHAATSATYAGDAAPFQRRLLIWAFAAWTPAGFRSPAVYPVRRARVNVSASRDRYGQIARQQRLKARALRDWGEQR